MKQKTDSEEWQAYLDRYHEQRKIAALKRPFDSDTMDKDAGMIEAAICASLKASHDFGQLTEKEKDRVIEYLEDPEKLTKKDLEQVKILNVGGISYTKPLAELQNLEELTLTSNTITDLTPIAQLKKLRQLDLSAEYITDPLRMLSDILPLSELTELEDLWLSHNSIHDLSPLADLTKLKQLHVWPNPITELSPLSSLTKLERLSIGVNGIKDLSPLYALKKLEWLFFMDDPSLSSEELKARPPVPEQEISKLQKALPDCAINHPYMTDATKVEFAVRQEIEKPSGQLTDIDFGKVIDFTLPSDFSDWRALGRLTGLRGLYLTREQKTDFDDEIKTLQRSLPDCHVHQS
tara:strand:- start:1466 stop:2512 length:1047 start_codon:yes stop_codon:yes gene_type:complete